MNPTPPELQRLRQSGVLLLTKPVAPAKLIASFAKANDQLVVKGGAMPNVVMDVAGVQALATMPSREELLAKLRAAGITYVPDFVANAGGVIQVHGGVAGWSDAETLAAVDRIGTRVGELLETADTEGITPLEAALRRADAALGRTVAR